MLNMALLEWLDLNGFGEDFFWEIIMFIELKILF
jgi:hypothetical protein